MNSSLEIYSDGASRGNPGPSAIAFWILSTDGRTLERHAEYVGVRTNNQAEYEAVIAALECASELSDQEVVCHTDSELVAKQLKGEYQVRNPKLRRLWRKVKDLERKFAKATFVHVPRTNRYIQEVDRWVNGKLDELS